MWYNLTTKINQNKILFSWDFSLRVVACRVTKRHWKLNFSSCENFSNFLTSISRSSSCNEQRHVSRWNKTRQIFHIPHTDVLVPCSRLHGEKFRQKCQCRLTNKYVLTREIFYKRRFCLSFTRRPSKKIWTVLLKKRNTENIGLGT